MNSKILVKGIEVNYKKVNEEDYICITDLAKFDKQESFLVISHWLRTRNTIDYLTAWETLYNPDFKPTEIGRFREECSKNSFTMTPQKWVNSTNAVGIFSKAGNKGGTYAHKDIAFKFASWLSVEFELYVIKEFQRLKEQEQK
ncbi:MAG: KilA-N domain-containing protein, partial [Christensenellaceae bacterium]|nr:KilA-N domain-containing protein [Christensenellaceae bacterium]